MRNKYKKFNKFNKKKFNQIRRPKFKYMKNKNIFLQKLPLHLMQKIMKNMTISEIHRNRLVLLDVIKEYLTKKKKINPKKIPKKHVRLIRLKRFRLPNFVVTRNLLIRDLYIRQFIKNKYGLLREKKFRNFILSYGSKLNLINFSTVFSKFESTLSSVLVKIAHSPNFYQSRFLVNGGFVSVNGQYSVDKYQILSYGDILEIKSTFFFVFQGKFQSKIRFSKRRKSLYPLVNYINYRGLRSLNRHRRPFFNKPRLPKRLPRWRRKELRLNKSLSNKRSISLFNLYSVDINNLIKKKLLVQPNSIKSMVILNSFVNSTDNSNGKFFTKLGNFNAINQFFFKKLLLNYKYCLFKNVYAYTFYTSSQKKFIFNNRLLSRLLRCVPVVQKRIKLFSEVTRSNTSQFSYNFITRHLSWVNRLKSAKGLTGIPNGVMYMKSNVKQIHVKSRIPLKRKLSRKQRKKLHPPEYKNHKSKKRIFSQKRLNKKIRFHSVHSNNYKLQYLPQDWYLTNYNYDMKLLTSSIGYNYKYFTLPRIKLHRLTIFRTKDRHKFDKILNENKRAFYYNDQVEYSVPKLVKFLQSVMLHQLIDSKKKKLHSLVKDVQPYQYGLAIDERTNFMFRKINRPFLHRIGLRHKKNLKLRRLKTRKAIKLRYKPFITVWRNVKHRNYVHNRFCKKHLLSIENNLILNKLDSETAFRYARNGTFFMRKLRSNRLIKASTITKNKKSSTVIALDLWNNLWAQAARKRKVDYINLTHTAHVLGIDDYTDRIPSPSQIVNSRIRRLGLFGNKINKIENDPHEITSYSNRINIKRLRNIARYHDKRVQKKNFIAVVKKLWYRFRKKNYKRKRRDRWYKKSKRVDKKTFNKKGVAYPQWINGFFPKISIIPPKKLLWNTQRRKCYSSLYDNQFIKTATVLSQRINRIKITANSLNSIFYNSLLLFNTSTKGFTANVLPSRIYLNSKVRNPNKRRSMYVKRQKLFVPKNTLPAYFNYYYTKKNTSNQKQLYTFKNFITRQTFFKTPFDIYLFKPISILRFSSSFKSLNRYKASIPNILSRLI